MSIDATLGGHRLSDILRLADEAPDELPDGFVVSRVHMAGHAVMKITTPAGTCYHYPGPTPPRPLQRLVPLHDGAPATFPRRRVTTFHTPWEKRLIELVRSLQDMQSSGADARLSAAELALEEARELVADWLEDVNPEGAPHHMRPVKP